MAWLADLVESSEGCLDMLPVQCLCEFLLHGGPTDIPTYIDTDDEDSKADKAKKKQVTHCKCSFINWGKIVALIVGSVSFNISIDQYGPQ